MGLAGKIDGFSGAEQVGSLLIQVRAALRRGESGAAQELLKQLFQLDPGNLEAIELLGDLYLQEGETAKAAELFGRAVKLHPKHPGFEEKLAVSLLDLAEIESDKLARAQVMETGVLDKSEDRSTEKALVLSLFIPGAGQFLNEENEKGTVLAVTGLIAFAGWMYGFLDAISSLPKPQRTDWLLAISDLQGLDAVLFYVLLPLWLAVYAFSAYDAVKSASRYNAERRRVLGL